MNLEKHMVKRNSGSSRAVGKGGGVLKEIFQQILILPFFKKLYNIGNISTDINAKGFRVLTSPLYKLGIYREQENGDS